MDSRSAGSRHDATSFAARLRRARTAAALTQEELAERAGLSVRGISALERGIHTTPRLATVRMLADALDLDVAGRAALIAAARPAANDAQPATGRLASLPAPSTRLIGRERELADLRAALRDGHARLVTLTGAGGSGKTRLAIAVAAELTADFPDGVVFVDLAPLRAPGMVVAAMAQAVGMREMASRPLLDQLNAFLREKRLLLVLDNVEHLLAAAPDVAALVAACPGLKVLATSRVRLRLREEREYPLDPLTVPAAALAGSGEPTLAEIAANPAVTLFVERARAAQPRFALTPENAKDLAAICARLDGLPLALELAAAWSKMLSPPALRARLTPGRLPLEGGARDLPERQQTIRAAIAWSYDLLPETDRTLFRRLGVFAGGFTLEAAETTANPDGDLDILGGVASLFDASLLRHAEGSAGEPRFRMLETVREFALEHLAASGEEANARDRLSGWFLDQSGEIRQAFFGAYPLSVIARLDAELADVRAALGWFEQTGSGEAMLRLVSAIGEFWYLTGRFREGRAWLERALAMAPATPSSERAWALGRLGFLDFHLGDVAAAIARLEDSAAMARASDLPDLEATAVVDRGIVAERSGDFAAAESLLRSARELFRQSGNDLGAALATYHLGNVAYGRDETARASALWDTALAEARAMGETALVVWCLMSMGLLAAEQDAPRQAAERLRECMALSGDIAFRHMRGGLLDTLAALAAACGMAVSAAQLQGAAKAVDIQSGGAPLPHRLAYERAARNLLATLGDACYASAYDEGSALRPDALAATAALVLDTASTLPASTPGN